MDWFAGLEYLSKPPMIENTFGSMKFIMEVTIVVAAAAVPKNDGKSFWMGFCWQMRMLGFMSSNTWSALWGLHTDKYTIAREDAMMTRTNAFAKNRIMTSFRRSNLDNFCCKACISCWEMSVYQDHQRWNFRDKLWKLWRWRNVDLQPPRPEWWCNPRLRM